MFEKLKGEKSKAEKRNLKRKAFSYYLQVVDDNEEKTLGCLTDISTQGFRLDCKQELPTNQTYSLRLDLPDEVAVKSSVILVARNRWCRRDEMDPFTFNIGFQIVSIAPEDAAIYQNIVQRYAA